MQKLASQDPDNADLQQYLLRCFNQIGDVLSAQGDLTAALDSYRHTLTIVKHSYQGPEQHGVETQLCYRARSS